MYLLLSLLLLPIGRAPRRVPGALRAASCARRSASCKHDGIRVCFEHCGVSGRHLSDNPVCCRDAIPRTCVCDHISTPALHATTNVCYPGKKVNAADSRGGMRKYSKVARNHCATTFQHCVSRFSQIVGTGCATRAIMIVTSQSRAHPQPWRNIGTTTIPSADTSARWGGFYW